MVRQVMLIKQTTCICFLGMINSNLSYTSIWFLSCTDGSLVIFRIGLGALLSGARHISDGMLQAAAEW